MSLTLLHFVLYIGLTWGSNILLNLLYIVELVFPAFVPYNTPLDGGRVFYDNRRILGRSTTIPGLFLSLLASSFLYQTNLPNYLFTIPILVFIGHLLGSFIKRRMGKVDGSFVPFIDHGDYMITVGLILSIAKVISVELGFAGLLFTYIAHPFVTLLSFRLGIRKYPY